MTADMAARVHELLDSGAMLMGTRFDRPCVYVRGRTGVYYVTAFNDRVECTCPAYGDCSHKAAAMVLWQERQRIEAANRNQ